MLSKETRSCDGLICQTHHVTLGRDARTISINIHSYPFLVDQLELTKAEILSSHL